MVSNSRDPLDTLLEEKKYFQFVLSSMEERKRKAACTLQSQVKAEKLTRYECVYIFTTICLIFGTYSTCGYFDRNQNESAPTSIDTTSLLPDFIVMRLGFNSMEGLGVSFLTLLACSICIWMYHTGGTSFHHSREATGIGTIIMEMNLPYTGSLKCTLTGVLFMPTLKTNLFSVLKVT